MYANAFASLSPNTVLEIKVIRARKLKRCRSTSIPIVKFILGRIEVRTNPPINGGSNPQFSNELVQIQLSKVDFYESLDFQIVVFEDGGDIYGETKMHITNVMNWIATNRFEGDITLDDDAGVVQVVVKVKHHDYLMTLLDPVDGSTRNFSKSRSRKSSKTSLSLKNTRKSKPTPQQSSDEMSSSFHRHVAHKHVAHSMHAKTHEHSHDVRGSMHSSVSPGVSTIRQQQAALETMDATVAPHPHPPPTHDASSASPVSFQSKYVETLNIPSYFKPFESMVELVDGPSLIFDEKDKLTIYEPMGSSSPSYDAAGPPDQSSSSSLCPAAIQATATTS